MSKKLVLNKLTNQKPKTIFSIALILLLTFSSILTILPIANAHDPAWSIPTFAYIVATPDIVGVGQTSVIAFWLNWVPPGAGGSGGDRWRNLSLEVTKPDGSKEQLGPFTSDPIGEATAYMYLLKSAHTLLLSAFQDKSHLSSDQQEFHR